MGQQHKTSLYHFTTFLIPSLKVWLFKIHDIALWYKYLTDSTWV